jgi:hypothetical protein
MTNSRAKGARGEREFIARHLIDRWPEAARNYDQTHADKRDIVRCGGIHWQVKYTENLRLWDAIRQAQQEAIGGDLPVVVFRRRRSSWYCIVAADDFVPLLAVALRVSGG